MAIHKTVLHEADLNVGGQTVKIFVQFFWPNCCRNCCPFQPGLDKGRSKFGTCRGGQIVEIRDISNTESELADSKNHNLGVKLGCQTAFECVNAAV